MQHSVLPLIPNIMPTTELLFCPHLPLSETEKTEKFSILAQVLQVEALLVVEETKTSKRLDHFFSGPVLCEATEHMTLVQKGLCRCRDQNQLLLFGAYLVICRQGLELKDADLVASLGQRPRAAQLQALSAV